MSEKSSNRATFDPTELWRQWYEAGNKMWSNALGDSRGSYADPYGLYRQWFNGLEDAWKRMFESVQRPPMVAGNGGPASLVNPAAAENPAAATKPVADAVAGQAVEAQNLWKQWFEAMSDSWQKAAALGAEAVHLTPRWLAMLDQMRHNFLTAEGYPTDPLQFATRWYNATSGPLSEFLGDLIEREEILDVSSQFLQSYASFYRVFRRDSEEYLKALQIPVRSDIARVAGLVVALEDKIDRIEEAFEDFEYGYAEPATAESLQAVEERIERLEQTFERVEGSAATSDSVSGLENRLDGVEAKIDQVASAESLGTVEERMSALEQTLERIEGSAATADSVSNLEQRLDGVEAKIDRLLTALENTSQNGTQPAPQAEASQEEESVSSQEEIRATNAARRKAEELGVDLSEVEGTGANGQITVADVRRENAREEGEG